MYTLDRPRPCGCKGVRTCLICENEYGVPKKDYDYLKGHVTYVYCPMCNKAWPGVNASDYETHPNHDGRPVEFPGIFIQLNFISDEEENFLICGIDEMLWDVSQSGRRKQNFGPKCNFKKQRLKLGEFNGFPKFTQFVQERFQSVPILAGYQTVEQCSLEYDPGRGASIDPHIDDCWIWGERIVTVNLLSNSTLTLMPYRGDSKRYNLHCVTKYHPVILGPLAETPAEDIVILVPMPRRSLLVMYGPARYNWEHCVLRENIRSRRVCLAYREFTPPYLEGGDSVEESKEILQKAKVFWDN